MPYLCQFKPLSVIKLCELVMIWKIGAAIAMLQIYCELLEVEHTEIVMI